jgi:hypothetical protein
VKYAISCTPDGTENGAGQESCYLQVVAQVHCARKQGNSAKTKREEEGRADVQLKSFGFWPIRSLAPILLNLKIRGWVQSFAA